MSRYARRIDDNQPEIVAAFRACGWYVRDTSRLGEGFPDLVVYRPQNGIVLVEIKDGTKPPSARRLTPDESEFARNCPVAVVYRVEDVLALSGQVDIPRVDIQQGAI